MISKLKSISFIICILLVTISCINTRLVIQPKYNHYVIATRLPETAIVFTSNNITTIWIKDTYFTPNYLSLDSDEVDN